MDSWLSETFAETRFTQKHYFKRHQQFMNRILVRIPPVKLNIYAKSQFPKAK